MKNGRGRSKKSKRYGKISIFRLKIYIFRLQIRIFKLQICIFSLKIENSWDVSNFSSELRKFSWDILIYFVGR